MKKYLPSLIGMMSMIIVGLLLMQLDQSGNPELVFFLKIVAFFMALVIFAKAIGVSSPLDK